MKERYSTPYIRWPRCWEVKNHEPKRGNKGYVLLSIRHYQRPQIHVEVELDVGSEKPVWAMWIPSKEPEYHFIPVDNHTGFINMVKKLLKNSKV